MERETQYQTSKDSHRKALFVNDLLFIDNVYVRGRYLVTIIKYGKLICNDSFNGRFYWIVDK